MAKPVRSRYNMLLGFFSALVVAKPCRVPQTRMRLDPSKVMALADEATKASGTCCPHAQLSIWDIYRCVLALSHANLLSLISIKLQGPAGFRARWRREICA